MGSYYGAGLDDVIEEYSQVPRRTGKAIYSEEAGGLTNCDGCFGSYSSPRNANEPEADRNLCNGGRVEDTRGKVTFWNKCPSWRACAEETQRRKGPRHLPVVDDRGYASFTAPAPMPVIDASPRPQPQPSSGTSPYGKLYQVRGIDTFRTSLPSRQGVSGGPTPTTPTQQQVRPQQRVAYANGYHAPPIYLPNSHDEIALRFLTNVLQHLLAALGNTTFAYVHNVDLFAHLF